MVGRATTAIVAALTLQAVTAAVARADGLPVLGFETAGHGVLAPDRSSHYVAQPRRHDTVVKALSQSGRTLRSAVLPDRFDVPVVAYDGSTGGLSADGRTLVLIRPRLSFPQRSTELAIVAPRTLRPRRFERLWGDFSFDAISPNGEWIYLIQYTSRRDPTHYRVRALSTRTGALLTRDIVDPHDRGEAMRGNPLSRVSSADGRWAYTLYDGNDHPFVHALDTARRQARCIDITAFPANTDWFAARLRLAGQRLIVVLGGRTLSEIDTKTLSMIKPALVNAPTAIRSRSRTAHTKSGRTAIVVAPVAAILFLGGTILAIRRRFAPWPRHTQLR